MCQDCFCIWFARKRHSSRGEIGVTSQHRASQAELGVTQSARGGRKTASLVKINLRRQVQPNQNRKTLTPKAHVMATTMLQNTRNVESVRATFNRETSRQIIGLVLLLLMPAFCFGDEAADLIKGALARSKAVTSGRLVYDWYRRGADGNGSGMGCKEPALFQYFSFSGDSWAAGGGGTSGKKNDFGYPVRSNHDGYFIQGFGNYAMSKSQPFDRILQHAPVWAGSFRTIEEEAAVKAFADRFKLIGEEEIDGVTSKVLEISEEDFDLTKERYPFRGSPTRYYFAPQMGYVVTAVESLNPKKEEWRGRRIPKEWQGTPFRKEWNTDWHEVAPGLYMPYKIYSRSGPDAPGQFGVNENAQV